MDTNKKRKREEGVASSLSLSEKIARRAFFMRDTSRDMPASSSSAPVFLEDDAASHEGEMEEDDAPSHEGEMEEDDAPSHEGEMEEDDAPSHEGAIEEDDFEPITYQLIKDQLRATKTPLKSVARDPRIIQHLQDYAERIHLAKTRAMVLLKAFYLYMLQRGGDTEIPVLSEKLLCEMFRLVTSTTRDVNERSPTASLQDFYLRVFSRVSSPGVLKVITVDRLHLAVPFKYAAAEILTNVKNIVCSLFVKVLKQLVEITVSDGGYFQAIEDEVAGKVITTECGKQKKEKLVSDAVDDIINFRMAEYKSNEAIATEVIPSLRNLCIPRNFSRRVTSDDTEEDNEEVGEDADTDNSSGEIKYDGSCNRTLLYYLKANWEEFWICMIMMGKQVAHLGGNFKLNIFPHVQSAIPGYFVIDNSIIFDLIFKVFSDQEERLNVGITLPKSSYQGKTELQKRHAWSILFNMDHRSFHEAEGRRFNYFARSNGYAIDLLFKKDIQAGLLYSETPRERYVEEIHADYLKRNVIAIDPGFQDAIYAVTGDKKFRISLASLRRGKKHKYYARKRKNMKKRETVKMPSSTLPPTQLEVVHGMRRHYVTMNLLEMEAWLAAATDRSDGTVYSINYGMKTLNYAHYISCVGYKQMYNSLVREPYEKTMWRKLRFGNYIHKKKCEDKAINNFTKKFGPPSDNVIAFGDYSSRHAGSLRGHYPVLKGIGMRRLLRKAGYAVYLVDEYLTSKSCHRCKTTTATCKTFRKCLNPKPKARRHRKYIERWGLVTCCGCFRIWNRDYNAAKNMEFVANLAMRGVERPKYLQRTRRD